MNAWSGMTLACLTLLAGASWLPLLARDEDRPSFRWVLAGMAGLVALVAGSQLLFLLGIGWTRLSLGALLGGWFVLGRLASRRHRVPPRPRSGPGDGWSWGDSGTAVAWGTFAVASLALWIVYPDFIFHWGIKGHRFFLAGGLDVAALADRWSFPVHPEYPHLFPILFAQTAVVAGRFEEAPMMVWTVLVFAALLVAARQVVRAEVAGRAARDGILLVCAFALAAFAMNHLLAGSPDWVLAAAPLVAWPALRNPDGTKADLQVGLAAGLAAGAKIEGIPLAAVLLSVHVVLRLRRVGVAALPSLALAALPTLLIAGPWWWIAKEHGLLQRTVGGAFSWESLPAVLSALKRSLGGTAWHGAPWALLALPALLARRGTRAVALVISGQLAMYLWVYLTTGIEDAQQLASYVRSNASRLAFHLLPTILVGAGILVTVGFRGTGAGGKEGEDGRRADGSTPD